MQAKKVIGFTMLVVAVLFVVALLTGCTTGNVNGLRKPTTPTVQPTLQPTLQPTSTATPEPTAIVAVILPTATAHIQGFAPVPPPQMVQDELAPCDTTQALPVTVEPDGTIYGHGLQCAYATAAALAGK